MPVAQVRRSDIAVCGSDVSLPRSNQNEAEGRREPEIRGLFVRRKTSSQKIIESRCQVSDAAAAFDRHLSSSTPRMRSHRIMITTLNRPTGAANVNTREQSG